MKERLRLLTCAALQPKIILTQAYRKELDRDDEVGLEHFERSALHFSLVYGGAVSRMGVVC